MPEKTLIAKIREDDAGSGTLLIVSPAVGMADGAPRTGIYVNPLDRLLTMKILNDRYVLRLPRDAHGRIEEALIPNATTALAYGQPIARLDPRGAAGVEEERGATAAGSASGSQDGADLIAITAPTEGIFYRRAAPDADPYVQEGSEITRGAVLGLIEVMKSFNTITYGGAALPERGTVVEVLAQDASEVTFGQPLFRIRPLD